MPSAPLGESNSPSSEPRSRNTRWKKDLGVLLTRIVVPCWVLAGVIFKLVEATPTNLPPTILQVGLKGLGMDAHWLLATLLALELFAVAVMFFLSRWARPMAAFMLVAFCLILLAEVFQGNVTNCGCFGTLPIPPWVMLIIDGSLLAGVLLTWQRHSQSETSAYVLALATAFFVLIAGFAYVRVLGVKADNQRVVVVETPNTPGGNQASPQADPHSATNSSSTAPVAPTQSTNTIQLPSFYYINDTDEWVGKSLSSIDLFQYMTQKPKDWNKGKRYIVFYRRTCDHCEELIYDHFYGEPLVPTTLVAFPEDTNGYATEGLWDMPCDGCEMLELPVGPDWAIEPPLVIALNNGKIICASEAEESYEPQCLPWHVEAGYLEPPN